MDFLYKKRRVIVVILACLMIGLGIFQGVTKIELDSSVMKTVEYVVMFGALYLLLILPKRYETKKKEAEPSQIDVVSDEDEAKEKED